MKTLKLNLICFFFLFIISSSTEAKDAFSKFEEDIFINHTRLNKVPNAEENEQYLKLNKEGIKVYVYKHKDSEFETFKATAQINATIDSILAVMFDNDSGSMWIDSCQQAYLIQKINFNQRYHYHVFDIPAPFQNRDFIFYSKLIQNKADNSFTIIMVSDANFCTDNKLVLCNKINNSNHFRVTKSLGAFKLEPKGQGTKITWIQDTDPGGNLPSWLVNKLVVNTPYYTFQNLTNIVNKKKYADARIIYSNQIAYDLFYSP